jgi:hypothetical protein
MRLKTNRPVEADREAPPSPLASFHTPAIRISFEVAQMFLQRAGKQLEVPDQEPNKARDRVAAILDQITRDTLIRSYNYDVKLPADSLREAGLMDPKKLAKIVDKMTLTPTSIAVRYLTWVHASLGTEEPNPLDGLLSELKNHIDLHHAHDRPHDLFRAAERQVWIWVGLYVSALLGWIEEVSATVPLVEIAAAHLQFGLSRSELNRQLGEQRDDLLECAAVMQIIEEEHLHAPILPEAWRRWLEPDELHAVIAQALERSGGRARAKARKPAQYTERARVKLAALLETAVATADITSSHQLILSLARAHITLINSREAWRQFSALLESRGAEPNRRKPVRSSPSVSPPARKSPSGAPQRKPR